jgi:multiple sugar transport system ATP-binding protein
MASVTLKHIEKIYPAQDKPDGKQNLRISEEGVHAVEDFNLEIKDQEFIVLVGPSGCGKSTTLRMIAGLESISRGDLYIDGTLMNNVPPKERDISMVFQNYALYPHMTVQENMEFPLKLRKTPKEEIRRRVQEAAEMLEIKDLLRRKPGALSGGQRQRVAIGRAIVRHPKVLLMDEPLSNLDAKLRNQMRAEIIQLRKQLKTTFIYVTHDQTEAMTLGDRIVIMKDGEIQQIGTPEEVYDHPTNLFVAGFIGVPKMNFFKGTLLKTGTEYKVEIEDVIFPLPKDACKTLVSSGTLVQDVIIGVRPENIVLMQTESLTQSGSAAKAQPLPTQPANAGLRALPGTADVSELMGATVQLHFTACGGDRTAVIPALQWESMQLQPGQPLAFSFLGSDIHLFSETSGKSLLREPEKV